MTHVPIQVIPLAHRLLQVTPHVWAEEVLALARLRDRLSEALGGSEAVCTALALIVDFDASRDEHALKSIARKLVSVLGVRWAADAVGTSYEHMVRLAMRPGLDVDTILAVSDHLRGRAVVNVTKTAKMFGCSYGTVRHLAELLDVPRSKQADLH